VSAAGAPPAALPGASPVVTREARVMWDLAGDGLTPHQIALYLGVDEYDVAEGLAAMAAQRVRADRAAAMGVPDAAALLAWAPHGPQRARTLGARIGTWLGELAELRRGRGQAA
jgi:hypothetical protein